MFIFYKNKHRILVYRLFENMTYGNEKNELLGNANSVDRGINFFGWYFYSKIKEKEDFFELNELCRMFGLTKEYFISQAEKRKIKIWICVPDTVEVRTFSIESVIDSEIKSEIDYLTSFTQHLPSFITDGNICVAYSDLMPMDYLLISFMDLRWHEKNEYCVFMEGVRYEDEEHKSELEIGNSCTNQCVSKKHYYRFNFARINNDIRRNKVFITCKVGAEEADPVEKEKDSYDIDCLPRLDKSRVEFIRKDQSVLYVEGFSLIEDGGFLKTLIEEMELYRCQIMKYLDVNGFNFLLFPEKLYYIFVVTMRNIERTKIGCKINRKDVVCDLGLFGFERKMVEDIATMIINCGDKKEKKKFIRKNEKENIEIFKKLSVRGLFDAYKQYRINVQDPKAKDIADFLYDNYAINNEAVRKISPVIAGTHLEKSWVGFPLNSEWEKERY